MSWQADANADVNADVDADATRKLMGLVIVASLMILSRLESRAPRALLIE